MDTNLIGKRIKEARTLRNLTLDDIADDIGVAKSTIQRYETGRIANPKIPVLHAIANSLQVNPSWLSGYDVPMVEEQQQKHAYYFDPETAEAAQAMKDYKELRLLFSEARTAKPEDLQTTYNVLLALKKKENSGDDQT